MPTPGPPRPRHSYIGASLSPCQMAAHRVPACHAPRRQASRNRNRIETSIVTPPSRRMTDGINPVSLERDALNARAHRSLLLAPALHRGRYAHRLAIFGDGAARDLDSSAAQPFHDGVVREHRPRALGIDELLDSVADRLRGMGFAAVGSRDRRGKEIFQL